MADSVIIRIEGDDAPFQKTLAGIEPAVAAALATAWAAMAESSRGSPQALPLRSRGSLRSSRQRISPAPAQPRSTAWPAAFCQTRLHAALR